MAFELKTVADDLRGALRHLFRPVWVISTCWQEQDYAMAATAVAEVSMAPPSMLVCINRSNAIFSAIEAHAPFAINVLASDHEQISRACGGGLKGSDRFSVGEWQRDDATGVPFLADAAASMIVRPSAHVDHGTHRVVIADVLSTTNNARPSALCYRDGAYVPMPADR